MAHLPPDSYHYSVLSDYYNQLSLQEKLEACSKLQKFRPHEPPLPTDSAFHFPNRYPLNLSHYSPVNEVYSPHPSSYSKVHPKKKIRMAYDKEIADSTSKRGFVPYPSISRHNEATNFTPTYAETSKSHLNIPKPPEASCPQTKISEEMESHGELPKLIPLYSEPPVPFPSPLTPCNSPGSTHEFPYSPVEDIKPISAHSNSGWTSSSSQSESDPYNEKPQDLRVSFSERLKDVARDILTASSIPQLNCSEIPELVALNPDPVKDDKTPTAVGKHGIFDESEKRMSRESSSHSPTHHHSIKASSPKCDNSCSSCYNPSPSSSTSKCSQSSQSASSSKDSKWTGKQKSSNSRTQFERYEKSPSTSVSQSDKIEDPEAYLRKPIVEWSYADVIFFLMDACKELHINPGDVKFKRSDNGSVLLQMTPNDFEVLAPNHGQRLYDYFVNFQTQHYMSTNSRNIPHRYNGNYSEDQGNYSRQEHVHTSHHQSYTSNNIYPHPYDPPEAHSNSSGHYDQYPSSPCHSSFPGESPANEYIPQGSQYSEHNHSSQSSEEMRQRKSYELPSAAWKIFPPLHNYEDPLSDPDEFEEEPPPAEPPKKRGPGRPPKPESERKRRPKKTGRLWEFIRNLLLDPKTCPSLLRWEDAHAGIFRIVQSDAIANKWGMRKNNEKMNYEKLSRAMRYYYKAKIFEPVLGKRLVYKFGINAKGWRPLNPNNPNFQNY